MKIQLNIWQAMYPSIKFHRKSAIYESKAQDAKSYVWKYGTSDLFISLTCRQKWQEITSELYEGQQPFDRPDVIARVKNLKV